MSALLFSVYLLKNLLSNMFKIPVRILLTFAD